MPKYITLGYVKHNGAKFQPGETLELTAREAAPLLKLKAISKLQEPPASSGEDNGTEAQAPAGKGGNAGGTTGQADQKPEPDKGGKDDQKAAPEKGGKQS